MVTLNEKIVKSAEIKDRIYYIWDNKIIGFGFKVIPNGKKKYAFRYLAPYGGRNAKQRWYLFGNNNVPSCSEARRIAIDLAKAVLKLRLLEIDCFENKPNLRAKWQAETYGLTETEVLYRGEQSASVLKKLWQSNRDFFYVKLKGKDVYRRYLGTLFIIRNDFEVDVNRYMLKYGGCLPYRPKPRRWKPKQ